MSYAVMEKKVIAEFESLADAISKEMQVAFEKPDCFFEIVSQRDGRALTLEERVFLSPIIPMQMEVLI